MRPRSLEGKISAKPRLVSSAGAHWFSPSAAYRRQAVLMILPYFLGSVLMVGLPILLVIGLSFFTYDGLGAPVWRGIDNFRIALSQPLFRVAVINSLRFAILAVPLRLMAALGLALLLSRPRRGSSLFRTAVYLPTVVPDIAFALLWLWILNPVYGPLNQLLRLLGFSPPAWLVDQYTALPALVMMSMFTIGEGFVILLAGLKAVPTETYDAAWVDGSSRWQALRYLTLPLLWPWMLLLLFRDFILTFQVTFTPAYIMTGGGPYYATYFLPQLIFEETITRLRFGVGAAMMVMMILITLGILILLFGIFQRWEYEER